MNLDSSQLYQIDSMNESAWRLRWYNPVQSLALAEAAYKYALNVSPMQFVHTTSTTQEHEEIYHKGLIYSLATQTCLNRWLGNGATAQAQAQELLRLLNKQSATWKDPEPRAMALFVLGALEATNRNIDKGFEYVFLALQALQDWPVSDVEIGIRVHLAMMYLDVKEYAKTRHQFAHALYIARQTKDITSQARVLMNVGQLYTETDRLDHATVILERCLQLTHQCDAELFRMYTASKLSMAYLRKQEYQLARQALTLCFDLAKQLADRRMLAFTLYHSGQLYLEQDMAQEAVHELLQAEEAVEEIGQYYVLIGICQTLSQAYKQLGQFDMALTYHEKFHQIHTDYFNEETAYTVQQLETDHKVETAEKEAEILRLKALVLEQEIDERKQAEKELIRARELAEEASQSKSYFLSHVTHELRTPLNGVLGMANLLHGTDLNSTQQDMLDTLRKSGDTLLTVINDILDFSKIEANKLELEKTHFDVRDCIETTLDIVRPTTTAKDLTLGYTIDKMVPDGFIQDITRVRQILTNLVGNAIKFTESGKIDVSVNAARIASSKQTDNQTPLFRIHFVVRDTGIGIPAGRLDRLFQPFSQVDASTTRKHGGTGLGLIISKRLCEMMGGEMWVESTEGVGSVFHFTIVAPQAEAKPQLQNNHKPVYNPKMADEKPLKILLAEDNIVNQKVALGILKRNGYIADVAANGLEVLDALQRQPYDVILMDCNMPEMDGVTATRRIREVWPPQAQPTIIALTADAMDQHKEAYLAAGMDDYLSKPFRVADLTAALERVFD